MNTITNNSDYDELNYIFNIIYNYFTESSKNNILNEKSYLEFKMMIQESIITFYPHLSYINNHLNLILDINYNIRGVNRLNLNKLKISSIQIIDFNKQFITNEERDNFYNMHYNNESIINKTILSDTQLKLYNQYEYLINLPQPIQKSKEWFEMRNDMLTASNGGAAIGECKYSSIKSIILDKIGLGKKFKENKFVYHGKKYEKIAIMIYEIIYNTKIGEFGLIQHPNISYLGASPDGISMSIDLDGKINKLLGRMLEIKCPPLRKIINNGNIIGDICPNYYWIQVQLQLECCNLPECDFWQCHLIEYKSEIEFNEDTVLDYIHSENQILNQNEQTNIDIEPEKIYINELIKKGAIIELLPIYQTNIPKDEMIEWYGKYIYPPTILKTPSEYKIWTTNTIKNLNVLYPELVSEYKFSKIVYWKLELSHNELITRQPEWFNKHKNTYAKFWNRVIYYRKHLNEAQEDLLDQRLSNEVFLYTDSDKIPKVKSLGQFKKDIINPSYNSNENLKKSIFIKTDDNLDKLTDNYDNSADIFISSDDNITKPKTAKTKFIYKKK